MKILTTSVAGQIVKYCDGTIREISAEIKFTIKRYFSKPHRFHSTVTYPSGIFLKGLIQGIMIIPCIKWNVKLLNNPSSL